MPADSGVTRSKPGQVRFQDFPAQTLAQNKKAKLVQLQQSHDLLQWTLHH